MDQARRIGQGALAAGLAVSLGRWPWHWHTHPLLATLSGLAVAAVVVGVWAVPRPAALRAAAAISAIDVIVVVRGWSAHLPLHCGCVRSARSPVLAGWGGMVMAVDVAVFCLAVWLSRPAGRTTHRLQG